MGDNLAVRVPKGITEQARVTVGNALDIKVASDGLIVLRPRHCQKCSLKDLVKGMIKLNAHDEIYRGKSAGREAWYWGHLCCA